MHGQVPHYNATPTMRIHKLDNVTQALRMLPPVGITTVFLSGAYARSRVVLSARR